MPKYPSVKIVTRNKFFILKLSFILQFYITEISPTTAPKPSDWTINVSTPYPDGSGNV